MDFEPEPNSEIENYNDEHFNHLEANFFSLQQNLNQFVDDRAGPSEPQMQECLLPPKETGAKPKQARPVVAAVASSALVPELVMEMPLSNLPSAEDVDHDEDCLDCAEIEFLRQTKPELRSFEETHCPLHRRQQLLPASSSPQRVEIKHDLTPVEAEMKVIPEEPRMTTVRDLMVTIYSVGCNFETVVEAINSIGVHLNTDAVKQYFDAILDEETSTMSVPEYLLYISKRGCNYKKLMELVQTYSIEPIDIHFYPVSF